MAFSPIPLFRRGSCNPATTGGGEEASVSGRLVRRSDRLVIRELGDWRDAGPAQGSPQKTNWPARGRPERYLWGIELWLRWFGPAKGPRGAGGLRITEASTEPNRLRQRSKGRPLTWLRKGRKGAKSWNSQAGNIRFVKPSKLRVGSENQGLATDRKASDHDRQ